MADFFEDKKPAEAESTEEQLEKIKIGEDEYDPKEVQSLIQLGKIGREAEEKFHTKIDKIWPQYTKGQQELKEAQQKAQESDLLRQQLADLQARTTPPVQSQYNSLPPDQRELVRRQLEEIYGGPIMTKQDFQVQQQATSLLGECHKLESEIDGADGRPKFDTEAVLKHMEDTGIKMPEKAYKDLYENEIDDWKSKKMKSSKGGGFYTQSSPMTSKEPPAVRPTKDNLNALVSEMLQEQPE
jgi:hypothetical protein